MSFTYVRSVFFKSAKVQQEIEQELKRPAPDSIKLLSLKMKRLKIKDRIVQLSKAMRRRKVRPAFRVSHA